MTEGDEPGYARFESGYDPADPLDQAIMANVISRLQTQRDVLSMFVRAKCSPFDSVRP